MTIANTKRKPLTVQVLTRDDWHELNGLTRHREGVQRPRTLTITDFRVRYLGNELGAALSPTDALGVYEYTESDDE